MSVREVGSAEFSQLSRRPEGKLLVTHFTATWCSRCQLLAPHFEELARRTLDVEFVEVFKDTSGLEAAKVSGVRKVPALHFYLGGGKIDEFIGGGDEKNDIAEIEQRVKQHKVAASTVGISGERADVQSLCRTDIAAAGVSTVLEASEMGQLTAAIKDWCPGRPEGLMLLYRASRDGWSPTAFHAKCGRSSPSIALVRLEARSGETAGSVVGGFSSVSWAGDNIYKASPDAFIFMLKDGSSSGSGSFQPMKWGVKCSEAGNAVWCSRADGPTFGLNDLQVEFSYNRARMFLGSRTYSIPAGSPYLTLGSDRLVVDLEVFLVCPQATTPPLTGAPLPPQRAGINGKRPLVSTTAQESTLFLIAKAAAIGDAQGIMDALQAVRRGKQREDVSHALTRTIGESAYGWFPPARGGEPPPVGPPSPRTAQALGTIASGGWVKARAILAAVVKDAGTKDPSAVYALALCDHKICGGSATATNQLLDSLAAEDLDLWPGSAFTHQHPDARAFPLGALVRAHLLAAPVAPSPQQQGTTNRVWGTPATPAQDPKARACALAVSFIRSPSKAREVGKVDSSSWTTAAELLVRENGWSLTTSLLNPSGRGGVGNSSMDGAQRGGVSGSSNKLVIKWQRLREQCPSEGMDLLFEMSGLDAIKAACLKHATLAVFNKEHGFDAAIGSYNIRLEGNPGTGKTTVARLYYRLLKDLGVFAAAEKRAQDAWVAEEAAAKEKADATKKASEDTERRAFQSAGLSYIPPTRTEQGSLSGAGKTTPSLPSGFVETTGADLSREGVRGLKETLEKIRKAGGGVLFVDEAYTLLPRGKDVLDSLLGEIENRRGELVVAFAGYAKEMEHLIESNDGLLSRFPNTWRFNDYSDEVLLDIFKGLMKQRKGPGELHLAATTKDKDRWARVAIARLGRQRGSRGFGNARAVRTLFDKSLERQAERLSDIDAHSDDDDSLDPFDLLKSDLDPFELQKSDLLGTTVASLDESTDWKTLRNMVGLGSVKEAVRALAELVKTNYVLEEAGEPLSYVALNRCMLGNPGTGKTTVAKLFAGILADLGLLSKGDVVLKTASDFVGSALGESEKKTRAILKASEGCVLVIDEAYSLAAAGGVGSGKGVDPFRAAVVDTLVEQVQNVPGEDRCVLLLGYREEMEEFLKSANQGLSRRFDLNNSFSFDDYTDEELLCILNEKLRQQHLTAGVDALLAASNVLAKRRASASHFGNGGEVSNLLSEATLRKQRRGDGSEKSRLDTELLPQDFDPENGKGLPDGDTLEDELFGDLVGCDSIKRQLKNIRSSFIHADRIGVDRRMVLNMNFRFTGAPGTGKTTVAGRVGRMFNQLDAIQSDEVVSCSPSDFSTGFVGQAAKKTKEIMDKAVGKVLFIDEAYGLNPRHGGGGASFMQEVVDQLVQCLTDAKYKGNMVVVLAGYEDDIDELMGCNPGLAGRFPETIHFKNLGLDESCVLLESSLTTEYCTELAPEAAAELRELVLPIVQARHFANGRSIKDLAQRVFTEIAKRVDDQHGDVRALTEDIRLATSAVLKQMMTGTGAAKVNAHMSVPPAFAFDTASPKAPEAPNMAKRTTTVEDDQMATDVMSTVEYKGPDHGPFLSNDEFNVFQKICKVAGVDGDSPPRVLQDSEDLWDAFQLSPSEGGAGFSRQEAEVFMRKVAADRAVALDRIGQEARDTSTRLDSAEAEAKAQLDEVEAELSKKQEEGVDRELLEKLLGLKLTKELAVCKAREERERELALEKAAQAALRRMGKCPAGFQWHRQGGGWRCSAGGHFVSGSVVSAEIKRGSAYGGCDGSTR